MIPDYRCLHVREIAYDDQGLKIGEGEWQFFYQEIEGYTHEPGVRNVLRLDRFNVANPPADGSSIACVLDMVVESERRYKVSCGNALQARPESLRHPGESRDQIPSRTWHGSGFRRDDE